MANELEKQSAARASVQFVNDGDIVGLGTGSTAAHAVRFLAERVRDGLRIQGIPTSRATKELAESLGIPLTTLDQFQEIDVTIDGADEIDPQLSLIKGGGGALLREKVIAYASRKVVIIGDSSKQVSVLGTFPLPVEVIGFARPVVAKHIVSLGAKVKVREYAYGNPFVTDEGHQILDCNFGEIHDPAALGNALKAIPGVVEHGLFIGMASIALIAKGDQIVELQKSAKEEKSSAHNVPQRGQ